MPNEITLNPGYPSEQTIEPGSIQIPDLWHIALDLNKTGKKVNALKDGQFQEVLAGDYILEAWHLAHALKRYIQDHPAGPETATARDVVSSGPCYCAENEHHDGVCMGPECHCHFDR